MSHIHRLAEKGIAHPPKWLPSNVHYETIMGSVAYGVSSDTSDMDVYAWCIPPKDEVFPHLRGEIIGFGKQKHRFANYQEHHLKDVDRDKEYDLNVYNIVDYFQLVMGNNPNMIDSLFTPDNCILHITRIGQMVRDKRKIFLHKKCWHTFKGYAYQQVHKMTVPDYNFCPTCNAAATVWEDVLHHQDTEAWIVQNDMNETYEEECRTGKRCAKCGTMSVKKKIKRKSEKRQETVENYGYDLKFAYHVVRLLNEVEMIMVEGDLDLQRNREQLKAIRRGEWSERQIKEYFSKKESELEKVYAESKLPYGPDEEKIKQLLLDCLEEHYGSLDKCLVQPDKAVQALRDVQAVLDKHRNLL
jgi:hypothetical protein